MKHLTRFAYIIVVALLATLGGAIAVTARVDGIDASVHQHRTTPDALPANVEVVFEIDFGAFTTPAEAFAARPDLFSPELAKSCYISPSTGAYVKATCQSYSGSGSRGFQVVGWAWNGCNRYIKMYGSVGSAPTRSSYIPSSGAGTFLPWPWSIVSSWIYKW